MQADAGQDQGAGGEEREGPVSFEQIMTELERVVEELEAGRLSLEDSLVAFERGTALSRRASAILEAAERRIEVLSGSTDKPALTPFEAVQ
jgi:exodeoxyribonuclease VII small subunit